MKCSYCGAEITGNSKFCPNCGAAVIRNNARFCPNCGRQALDWEDVCASCGTRLMGTDEQTMRNNSPYNQQRHGSDKTVLIVVIVAAVLVFAAAFAIGFAFINPEKSDEEPQPSVAAVTQTPAPTASPEAANTAIPVVVIDGDDPDAVQATSAPVYKDKEEARQVQPKYLTYNSGKYNFSCAYPSSFKTTIVNDPLILYSCESQDARADLYINGTVNTAGLSPSTVFENFVASYGGVVDYRSIGDTYCAGSTAGGGRSHYCYYKLTGGMIRGFEMHYPTSQRDYYDQMINEIYNSISFY